MESMENSALQTWATVMPRFMQGIPDAQPSLLETLLKVEREERRWYAKTMSGQMLVIGQDSFASQLVTMIIQNRLCMELAWGGSEEMPNAGQLRRLQQLGWLSGSATQVSGYNLMMTEESKPSHLFQADFILSAVENLNPWSYKHLVLKSKGSILLYGETADVLREMPLISEKFENATVVGFESKNEQTLLSNIKSYLEAKLFHRDYTGSCLTLPSRQIEPSLHHMTIRELV